MTSEINLHNYADLLYDTLKNNGNSTPIYGPYEKLFLSDWGQSEIHYDIVQAFDKMNISQMTPIQKNSFLYLMKHYNTVMIGFSKGKSVSYLASIFSSIMNKSGDKMDDVYIGPKAVILSNSLGSCSTLESLSNKLMFSAKKENKLKVVTVYASVSVQSTIAAVCNGCDILIATPTSLLNMLNKTKIISWSNLRHFVFDNIDVLLENYNDQMGFFLNTLKKLKENTNNIQLICTSIKWINKLDKYLKLLFVKWQYIFGSHLEAAQYMKIGFNVVQVKDNKLEQILKYLKTNVNCRRCVLITSDSNELVNIFNYIQQNDSDIKVLFPGKIKSAIVYMLQEWFKPLDKNQLLMICSDDMMFDFYIDNADCLIHYDIPVNKETFSIRFSVLQDSQNLFMKKKRSSYVFLNNNSKDMLQLPKIVEIMKSFGNGKVEPILQKHAQIIIETLEKEKKNCLFCLNVQQFGYCSNPITCQYRHILFKELDEPAVNIPKSGLAIIKILNIYDASHMSAKLLKLNCTSNLNDGEHWLNVEDHSATINFKLNSFYSNPNSRILHKNPKSSDIVAVPLNIKSREHMNTEYFRAIIIDEIDENTMYPKVRVKLIDLGLIEIVPKFQVFVLPDMLKNIQTNTVDIFLASVKPCDLDKTWCSQANLHIKNEFKYFCNNTIIVKVKMALGTTIWINKLYKKYWNSKLKKYDFGVILPDTLFNIGYADLNNEHLKELKKLCTSVGIHIINDHIVKEEENNEIDIDKFMSLYRLPQPQWSHLEQSILVNVEFVINPKMIFVQNCKYLDRCIDLLAMIEHYIDRKQVEELEHVVIGAICLAKNPYLDKYCRVQIIEILKDGYVEVLFVDYGHFHEIQQNTLLRIHPNLITQLPFQAIECGLSGVKDTFPASGEFDELVDYIITLTKDPMHVDIIDTTLPAKYTGGNHYEVILYNQNITVNSEFQTNYSQYCDPTSTANSIITDDVNFENNNNNEEKYIINVNNLFEENNMESEKQFYENLAIVLFGQEKYKLLMENAQVVEDKNKEDSLKITEEITSVAIPEKECVKSSTIIEVAEESKPLTTIKSSTYKKPKQKKLKHTGKRKNVCLICNTNVQSIVPMCYWHQDKNYIYIILNILEVDDFEINHTMNSITFSAKFKNSSYCFHVILYAFIFEHSITYKRSFKGFHIKAEKLYKIDYKWPRLFECHKLHSYLKYDPEHIETDEGFLNHWIKKVEKLKFIAVGKSLNIAVEDDDLLINSSSDDEEFIDELNL